MGKTGGVTEPLKAADFLWLEFKRRAVGEVRETPPPPPPHTHRVSRTPCAMAGLKMEGEM